MAYVHCHAKGCGWQQDDFYDVGYNPAVSLSGWNDYLFGPESSRLDKQFASDSEFVKREGAITTREIIAREYEKFAKRIREMKWMTWEDFKKDPNKVCPKCGSDDLDID
jgi:hypothetical protein